MSTFYQYDHINDTDIAIIAMSCRFPGADTIEAFWQNLRNGVESISFFSEEELLEAGIDPELVKKPNYIRAKGTLSDVELFDASFFGFSPREASQMDPQHRLFLEEAWKIIETAGYHPDFYEGLIGLYAGIGMNTYLLNNLSTQRRHLEETTGIFPLLIGNDKDYMPTKASYKLNLKGPSVNVQSACSTSLVATHLACQALLNGECDMALAGGVSLQIPHKSGYLYQEGMILSPDGHCRAFDANAKGIVYGNGVGLIMLKRLADAVADGDEIQAIIKGSAINNDGSLKVAYTAPGVDGQAAVIAEAQAVADVDPDTISYIETHGTGTALGDPIEIAALTKAFREQSQALPLQFCAIGSVKTNVGHLDTAAAVAGVIKTVLALKHRQIPPSLHFEAPNPQIDFASTPFYVNTTLADWNSEDSPRRAGVSSFGFGGTNAHIILEEAPPRLASGNSRPAQLLVLSAKSEAALDMATTHLGTHLAQHPELNLADAAYTLQIGRHVFNHRRILVCQDREEALTLLRSPNAKQVLTKVQEPAARPVVFLFPGQGAQYVNMARELYDTEETFRNCVNECAELLEPLMGFDLRTILYPEQEHSEAAAQQLQQTAMTQPAIFVIEYALAQLFMEWGLQPQAVLGHSIGEFTAACIAGVFSLEDALKLVVARGQLMQSCEPGAMLSIPLPEAEVLPLLNPELSIAAVNAPTQAVVSGPTEAIEALQQMLAEEKISGIRLHTSHAFHSPMMDPILQPFAAILKKIALNPPQIGWVSTVTGNWITAEETTDPSYWTKNLRQTVRFADAVQHLFENPAHILLEVGPGRTLSSLAGRHPNKAKEQVTLSSLRHPQSKETDLAFLLTTLGNLWLEGAQIDWNGFYSHEDRYRVALPPYPFERKKYWIDPQEAHKAAVVSDERKSNIADWFYLPTWKRMPLVNLSEESLKAAEPSCWLIFSDEYGLGDRLSAWLQSEGQEVITAHPGTEYRRENADKFILKPDHQESYDNLFVELRASQKIPHHLVHLWSITSDHRGKSFFERVRYSQERGFDSLICIAKVLGKEIIQGKYQLTVLSNNMQEVTGDDLFYPEKATLLGPCKVIPQEYPHIACRSIDLTHSHLSSEYVEKILQQIQMELSTKIVDSIAAYRGNQRWVKLFEPIKIEHPAKKVLKIKTGGVYIITGGLGGIGLTLAEHFARTTSVNLVLIGRSAFPPGKNWDTWIAVHGETDAISHKIRKLQELEQLGTKVMVVSADVSNQQRMHEVIEQILGEFRAIHGVIHAAGVPAGGLIQQKTPDLVRETFASKIYGTIALASVLEGISLDFFVLSSSLASFLGGFGQVDYCAANAFLDAFACYNTSFSDVPMISINWDAWRDVGMAVEAVKKVTHTENRTFQQAENVVHHLFRQRIAEPYQQTLISVLSVDEDWMVAEHRVLGKAALPGTAYLEIARAAFELVTGKKFCEIREIQFLFPLTVEEKEEKVVHIKLKEHKEGFDFAIMSQGSPNNLQWQEHARGSIRGIATEKDVFHDINAIKNRCGGQKITVTGEEQKPHAGFIEYGPRWQNVKEFFPGEYEGLLFLELPPEFSDDCELFPLHPALMDSATGFLAVKNEGTCLPFSYKNLKLKHALPRSIFSHIRYLSEITSSSDTLKFQILIMDKKGKELIKIEDYTLRKVDPTKLKLSSVKDREAISTLQISSPTSAYSVVLKKGISKEEGIEVFDRILATTFPQLIVSTYDLSLRIAQDNPFKDVDVSETLEKADSSKSLHTRPELNQPYVAPETETEQTLVEIWQAFLGIEQIGIHDDFFELGGDSLLGTQVMSRIRETFQVELPIGGLFEDPTVSGLAKQIEAIRWGVQESMSVDRQVLSDEEREEGEI